MASTFIMQLKKEGSLQVIILLQHILYICTLHEGETLMQEGEIQSKHEGTVVLVMTCLINGSYAPQVLS